MTLLATLHLDANLAALGQRNADLAEQLASAPPLTSFTLADTADGVPGAALEGRQLCSRHHPMEEAARLVQDIDLVEHAVVVVMGFALGYHVQQLAQRTGKAGVIVVFEPDLALLRAVFEQIDHSKWMRDALLVFITDAGDRSALARKLDGAESILAQGVEFLEHPPSRERLGPARDRFSRLFSEYVNVAKTTLMTTLMRSVDTVRNVMLNADHYVGGDGIAELRDIASGLPAVIVSAGPSLHKNMMLLAEPGGVRERCVIIAVQTTLKPLLAAGIKPHFVTALDYHEISKRFYEDLCAEDLRDVTLVAEPKVNPVVLDAYPGPIRCCSSSFLDQLLGPVKREMGDLPAGATVAHLAFYLARFLGCNPIAMIGQDLGFSDGLYYAPGAAIHDVWSTELNPFNTIAMMEWQRIARHRAHLHKTTDISGRSIYTDVQMQTYLQQFERDFGKFLRAGLKIIDATEGGVPKQHTIAMPLHETLRQYATRPLPIFPVPPMQLNPARLELARGRLKNVRQNVCKIQDVSRSTLDLLQKMLADQKNPAKMQRHFHKMDQHRKQIDARMECFELINQLSQMGVFKRAKADRRLHMLTAAGNLDPLARQRGELERDVQNVQWLIDAAAEFLRQIDATDALLRHTPDVTSAPPTRNIRIFSDECRADPDLPRCARQVRRETDSRVAAVIAIDSQRLMQGSPRSLCESLHGNNVLQTTLQRLGKSQTLQSIVLLVERQSVEALQKLINPAAIGLPVHIEPLETLPFGPEHEAIMKARLWADSCWRGGIAGMSIYDEALCPQAMHAVMHKRGINAALIVGPDWPLVDVTSDQGCDAVVRRYLQHRGQHNLVFTQAPPGLCGCVISAGLMAELSQRNRLSTVGGLLVYQPHAPQHDPIARDVNVQIDHRVRRSLIRATFDSPQQRDLLRSAELSSTLCAGAVVEAIERAGNRKHHAGEIYPPRYITLELCTHRTSSGIFSQNTLGTIKRQPISPLTVARVFDQLADWTGESIEGVGLTLAGLGDPLLHSDFDQIIALAKARGIAGVHVRTELLADCSAVDRLLASGVDVVSIDVNADRAATYKKVMGVDRFKDVLGNIERLVENRRRLTSHAGAAGFALPWVAPRLQRRDETYEDIDTFFDRWQHTLGTVVIDDPPPHALPSALTPALNPARVKQRESVRHMTVLCDGSVPLELDDLSGGAIAGSIDSHDLKFLWKRVIEQRLARHPAWAPGRNEVVHAR